MFAGCWEQMVTKEVSKDIAIYFFALFASVVLTALQLYTLVIYYHMYRSDCKQSKLAEVDEENHVDELEVIPKKSTLTAFSIHDVDGAFNLPRSMSKRSLENGK